MADPPPSLTPAPKGYADWLADLKASIYTAQQRAALRANVELIRLYWHIGHEIIDRIETQGWGTKVIDRLAHDLRTAFPEMKGFSTRNLKYMRQFAKAWPDPEFGQQLVARLPWSHNLVLLSKLKDGEIRRWYAEKALENGWSRNVLAMQIDTGAHRRLGAATTNFAEVLPTPDSDLAVQSLKDPYKLDFLGLGDEAQEREIEHGLAQHVEEFLLELGAGFAFVGRQVRMEVGGDDFS